MTAQTESKPRVIAYQAIRTRCLPATSYKSTRIKAACARGSITISWPDAQDNTAAHIAAADALCERFVSEDAKLYGSPRNGNPWAKRRAVGCLPDGSHAHVFLA